MKINIIDNKKFDTTTISKNWVENHDWYRSIDTFHDRFPKDFEFTYWEKTNNDISRYTDSDNTQKNLGDKQ